MKRRLFALALALLLAVSLPVSALAATWYLENGDIIIDGGNSFFKDTMRRTKELESKGMRILW